MYTKIEPIDYKHVGVDPDPNFDAEHNRRVIKETIEENERLRARRQREYGSKIRDKSEAVARYVTDLADGKTNSNVEKYFGRKELLRMRGEEIRDIIKAKISDGTKQKAWSKAKKVSPPKLG